MRRSPPHTKDCRSGVCGSRMTCLGPGREGMGITSLGRDAQGLTFSVVIPARVLQPEVSTRGKLNWRLALCCYGMTLAQRHRVHLVCVASLAHLRCAHRLRCSLAGLCWRVRVGLAPGPPMLSPEGKVGTLAPPTAATDSPAQGRTQATAPTPPPSAVASRPSSARAVAPARAEGGLWPGRGAAGRLVVLAPLVEGGATVMTEDAMV